VQRAESAKIGVQSAKTLPSNIRPVRFGFGNEDAPPTVGHRRVRKGSAPMIPVSRIMPVIVDDLPMTLTIRFSVVDRSAV
jgi:hypothetical protein